MQLVSRRGFLGSMFSAGALILAAQVLPVKGRDALAAAEGSESPWYPSVYLGIEPSGTVIIVAHRSEMGTGIRTALPMVAADELDADWQRVTVEQAIGDPKYGDQNTDGSKSIRDFYDPLRQAGATARLMLERAAAAKWGVPVAQCQARNHQVVHAASGRSLGYGELVTLAAQQPVPKQEELRFKSPAEFRYIGKGVPIVDLDDICTGKATYGFDAQMPGMVYASIARSPVIGGTLKSYNDQDTRQVRGVQQTVVIPPAKPPYAFQALGGVAVIADSTWAAMQGRQKLKVEWDPGENASYDSEAYKQSLFETAEKPQKAVRNVGDVDAEFASASKILVLTREYFEKGEKSALRLGLNETDLIGGLAGETTPRLGTRVSPSRVRSLQADAHRPRQRPLHLDDQERQAPDLPRPGLCDSLLRDPRHGLLRPSHSGGEGEHGVEDAAGRRRPDGPHLRPWRDGGNDAGMAGPGRRQSAPDPRRSAAGAAGHSGPTRREVARHSSPARLGGR